MYKDGCKQGYHIAFTKHYREVGKEASAKLFEVNNIIHFYMVENVLNVVVIY